LIAHDELDLPPGEAQIKQSAGHGGHHELHSIFSCLGHQDFLSLRLGIGHPGKNRSVNDYVSHRPSQHDEQLIDAASGHGNRTGLLRKHSTKQENLSPRKPHHSQTSKTGQRDQTPFICSFSVR
jgi:peptidyl-tRNA hydrolase